MNDNSTTSAPTLLDVSRSPSISSSPMPSSLPSLSTPPSSLPSIGPTTISPSQSPVPLTDAHQIILGVALEGGAEFFIDTTYQSRALEYVKSVEAISPQSAVEYISLYVLGCIFYSTADEDPSIQQLQQQQVEAEPLFDIHVSPGWTVMDGWLSTTVDKCDWYGVVCANRQHVLQIELSGNRLIGTFPPEVQLLAPTLRYLNIGRNPSLSIEPDWFRHLSNLLTLQIESTLCRSDGIPTEIGALTKLGRWACGMTIVLNVIVLIAFERRMCQRILC